MRARTVIAVVMGLLAAPASAGAVGVAYIDQGNIQVATVDGASRTPLTNDGSASRAYEAITQTVSGHVFASIGNGNTSLKQFAQYGPLGVKLSEYPAPYDNLGGWTLFAYPLGFEVDSARANIAYGYVVSRTGALEQGTWVAPSDHTAGSPPFEKEGVNQPTFLGQRIVGVDNAGQTVLVQDAPNAPYQNGYTPWLSIAGAPNIELKRVAIAPNQTTYAIEYANTATATRHVELHRHEGAPIPGGTDVIACDFATAANPEHVTFSPDSTKLAWHDADGVKVAPVPDLTAPGASCPSPATLISASGTSPALGGIDVPALTAADPTNPTDPNDPTNPDDPKPPQPDVVPPETTKGKGPAKRITKAKAKFEFSSSEPGSTFTCKLDRKAAKPCQSPAKVKRLKPGKHKFIALATDTAGNADASPAVWKFRVVVP